MLNNRILVIGFDNRTLELLGQIRSDFVFLSLAHPTKYLANNHAFEAVIFNGSMAADMPTVLVDFVGRPVFGIGNPVNMDGVKWLENIEKPIEFEKALVDALGTVRAPPRNTGLIEIGTVVKNKTFVSWGVGVVKRAMENDLYVVHFPGAKKIVKKEEHICHKSILRIICGLKELTNEAS